MTLEELIRIYGPSLQAEQGAATPAPNPRQFTGYGMMPLHGRHGSFPRYLPGLLGRSVPAQAAALRAEQGAAVSAREIEMMRQLVAQYDRETRR